MLGDKTARVWKNAEGHPRRNAASWSAARDEKYKTRLKGEDRQGLAIVAARCERKSRNAEKFPAESHAVPLRHTRDCVSTLPENACGLRASLLSRNLTFECLCPLK